MDFTVPGESDDVLDLLAEDEDEDRGRAVAWADLVGADDALDCVLLVNRGPPSTGRCVRPSGGWGGFSAGTMRVVDGPAADDRSRASARRAPSGRATVVDPDVLAWMIGVFCIVGALLGFVLLASVEFDESRDVATAALYGGPGLVAGALVGLLAGLPTGGVLLLLRRRGRSRAVCVVVTAVSAAVVVSGSLLVVSGFGASGPFLLVLAALAAVPAGLTAAWVGRGDRRVRGVPA